MTIIRLAFRKRGVFNCFAKLCRNERSVKEISQTSDERSSDDLLLTHYLSVMLSKRCRRRVLFVVQCNASQI